MHLFYLKLSFPHVCTQRIALSAICLQKVLTHLNMPNFFQSISTESNSVRKWVNENIIAILLQNCYYKSNLFYIKYNNLNYL